MTLTEYCVEQGRGAQTRLMRRTGLAYPTVLAAVRGVPVRYDTARKLSLATGGVVTVEEIALLGADAVLPSNDDDVANASADDVRRSSAA